MSKYLVDSLLSRDFTASKKNQVSYLDRVTTGAVEADEDFFLTDIAQVLGITAVSSVSSFINSGIAIGNYFGSDISDMEVEDWIPDSFEDDYERSKRGYDLAGDIAASLVPGTGAVMAARKVAKGSKYLSHLYDTRQVKKLHNSKVREALKEFADTGSFNKRAFFGNIFGRSALVGAVEGATFELGAYAGTQLFKDLDKDDLDYMDIIDRAATGAIVGGGINAAFHGLGSYIGVNKKLNKRLKKAEDPLEVGGLLKASGEGNRVVHHKHNMEKITESVPSSHAVESMLTVERVSIDESLRKLVEHSDTDKSLFDQVSIAVKNLSYEYTRNLLSGHTSIGRVAKRTTGANLAVKERALLPIPKQVLQYMDDMADEIGNPLALLIQKASTEPELLPKRVLNFVTKNESDLKRNIKTESYVNLDTGARYEELLEPFLADFGIKTVRLGKDVTKGTVELMDGEILKWGKSPQINRVIAQALIKKAISEKKGASGMLGTKAKVLDEKTLEEYEALSEIITLGRVVQDDIVYPVGIHTKEELYEGVKKLKMELLGKALKEGHSSDKILQDLGVRVEHTVVKAEGDKWVTLAQGDLQRATHVRAVSSPTTFSLDAKEAFLWDKMAYSQLEDFALVTGTGVLGLSIDSLPQFPKYLLKGVIDSGASLLSSAAVKGGYLGTEQTLSNIGVITHNVTKRKSYEALESLDPSFAQMKIEQHGVEEWGKVRMWYDNLSSKHRVQLGNFNNGQTYLATKKVADEMRDLDALPANGISGVDYILIKNVATARWLNEWQSTHAPIAKEKLATLKAEGYHPKYGHEDFYLPPEPIKFGAIVYKSGGLKGVTKVGMLRAENAEHLKALMANIKASEEEYTVRAISDIDDYYNAVGQYDVSRSFSKKYDSEFNSKKGEGANVHPNLNGGVIAEQLQAYVHSAISKNTRRAVRLVYSKEYSILESLRERQVDLQQSAKKGQGLSLFDAKVTPAGNAIKTMLDVPPDQAIEALSTLGNTVDSVISGYLTKATELFKTSTGKRDRSLLVDKANLGDTMERLNDLYEELGGTQFKTASDVILNSRPDLNKRYLQKFLSTLNNWSAIGMLKMDGIDGLVNNMTSAILGSMEFKEIYKSLPKENQEIMLKYFSLQGAGQKELSAINSTLSGMRVYADRSTGGAYEKFVDKWKARGGGLWIDADEAFNRTGAVLADTINGNFKNLKKANSALRKLGRMTFFISDNLNDHAQLQVLHMVDNIAEIAGLNERQIVSLASTLKNRVLGHNIPSQKPTLFHGVIGTPISLYQNYNLNILNMMFKYAGDKKSLLRFGAMQTGVFGLQGTPGFHHLNEAVHTIYGKEEGHDIKSIVDDIGGMATTKWLMYGSGSVAVDGALYSRGDLNQRNQFIIPTTAEEIPTVRAITQVYNSFRQGVTDVANGVPVFDASLDALAHSQINRPLTGIIDAYRSYSTSQKGNLAGRTLAEATSWRGNVARILGARPFEEALIRERQWRLGSYQADSQKEVGRLGQSLNRLLLSKDGNLSQEELDTFRNKYMKEGKTVEQFEKWFNNKVKHWDEDAVDRLERKVKGTRYEDTFMQYFR